MTDAPAPSPQLDFKARAKAALAPLVRAVWPLLEWVAEVATARRGLQVTWADAWNPELDAALERLPPLAGCTHAAYRALLRPTQARKRHALVSDGDAPLALISLRRRGLAWEPVAFQCVPFAIAPARDADSMGRALGALGVNTIVAGGIGEEVGALKPSASWAYDWHVIDLTADYEAYWRQKKRQYTISRARRHLKDMEVRIDGEGDLAWIVEKWREQWAGDPGQEIVAAEDRLDFWPQLMGPRDVDALRVRTLQLLSTEGRVGGLVFTTRGETAMAQCGGREAARDDGYLAAAFTLALVDWAKANGFKAIDMAGGEYKRHWGPVGGRRYGAAFTPPLLAAFGWATR